MLTMGIAQRVFQLKLKTQIGTAFTLDIDSKQYLVTAKHVLKDDPNPSRITLWHHGSWRDFESRFGE